MSNFPALIDDLLKSAIASLKPLHKLEGRLQTLESIYANVRETELRVAVVGITSSGKSTFLNALMGEPLLPEESRATTNLMVRCRSGAERKLEIRYQNGRVETFASDMLTPEVVKSLCSETLNPGNEKGIEFLEWTMPDAVLPPGLVLLDTPGLDAFGNQDHEELTLRKFLPSADIVVYMTSIRNPFKEVDLKLVESIVENDQRVLFVLTQADLEVDSFQRGLLWRSREDKLAKHLERLKKDIAKHTTLQGFGSVLVSSELAKRGFKDWQSADWQKSGFDQVVGFLQQFMLDLDLFVGEKRLRAVTKRLLDAQGDVEHMIRQAEPGSQPSTREIELKARVSELDKARDILKDKVDHLAEDWNLALAPEALIRSAEVAFSAVGDRDVDHFVSTYRQQERHWDQLKSELDRSLEEAQAYARNQLKKFSIQPDRTQMKQAAMATTSFPRVHTYMDPRSEKVKLHGWRWGLPPWPEYDVKHFYQIDKRGFIESLKGSLRHHCQLQIQLLTFRLQYMASVYLEPLERRLKEEAEGLDALTQARVSSRKELKAARRIHAHMGQLLARGEAALAGSTTSAQPTLDESFKRIAQSPLLQRDLDADDLDGEGSPSLERRFRKDFFRFLGHAGLPDEPTILLLGLHREPHIRLAALLAKDLDLTRRWGTPAKDAWLVWGSGPRLHLPGRVVSLRVPRGLSRQFRLVIGPADTTLASIDWDTFLTQFDAVGVELEANRIASGLSDLARAPYAAALGRRADRIFQTSGMGAMFGAGRLANLVTDVGHEAAKHAPWGDRPWFVYEDYDARYTWFIQLAEQLIHQDGTPRELVRRWKHEGLSLATPFNEADLLQAAQDVLAHKARPLPRSSNGEPDGLQQRIRDLA